MKITSIESQKKNPGRVNIYVDGEFSFGIYEKYIVDYDLFKGKEVSQGDIEKYKSGDLLSKCLDKAYRFLSYRPRSEKEMRDKLLEKYDDAMVESAIKSLKKDGYVNDEEFARMWVNSRVSGKSARALRFELQRKGVSKEVIENAISGVDKDKELISAIELVKSKSKYQNLTRDEAYKKIGGFLTRRGYSYEIVKKVIEEMEV